MVDILIACIFMAVPILIIPITLYFVLKKPTQNNIISKKIVYSYKQDNTNPTITDLVEFHKKNETVDYKINK